MYIYRVPEHITDVVMKMADESGKKPHNIITEELSKLIIPSSDNI